MGNFQYLPSLLLLLLFGSCRSSPGFDFGAYSAAEEFYERGEYRKAIEKYEEYVRENPEGNMAAIADYYRAKSYENLGEVDKARGLYAKVVKNHPAVIWANFSKTRLEKLQSKSAPQGT